MVLSICCMSYQLDECGTRPFFRLIWMQGRSPDIPSSSKNSLGPIGIPLTGAPQMPGDKPSSSKEGYSLGGQPPRLEENQSWHAWHECRLPRIHVRQPQPTVTGTRTHPTWSVYRATRPTKVCLSSVMPRLVLTIYWMYPLQRSMTHPTKKEVSWIWHLTASAGEAPLEEI